MKIVIGKAKVIEALGISKIAKDTFPLACPKDSNVQEIESYCEKNLGVDTFQKLIISQSSYVICAFVDKELAGFVVLIFESTCPARPSLEGPAELQKFYVKTKFHGTDVTPCLMNAAINECRKRKYTDIWLGVFSNNERAKRFYSKFEFVVVGTTHFIMGSEIHLDNLMVAKIT